MSIADLSARLTVSAAACRLLADEQGQQHLGRTAQSDWDALVAHGVPRTYARGQTIFLRGDPGEHILWLTSGFVAVELVQSSGRKSLLARMGPGEVLGEIALLDGKSRSADATAITEVSAVVIDRRKIMQHLVDKPEIMFRLFDALCDKVRNASEMFEAQSLSSAPEKLARCLVTIHRKWGIPEGTAIRVSQNFTQTELGAFAGVARENVNRHMRAWAEEGLLEFDDGDLVILDPEELSLRAGF